MRVLLIQVLGLLIGCGFVAGCAYNPLINREQLMLVSESQMVDLAAESWDEVQTTMLVSNDGFLNRRASSVANRILTANGENPDDWEIRVFEDATLNAFALPGGKIGVTSAMMEFCLSNDQLAAVIAHEIAHVKLRHASERLSQDLAMRGAIDAAFPDQSRMRSIFGIGATLGVLLPYSRQHELEADRLGLRYLVKANYSADAAITLWTRMSEAASTRTTPEWLSTHPTNQSRIEALRAEIDIIEQEQAT